MPRYYKYLWIFLALVLTGWGMSKLAANTRPNTQMVLYNQTGQPLVRIQLKIEKSQQNMHFSGIDTGAQLTIHLHNRDKDMSQLFLELADGKKMVSDPVPIAPGDRIVHSVTREGIVSRHDPEIQSQARTSS